MRTKSLHKVPPANGKRPPLALGQRTQLVAKGKACQGKLQHDHAGRTRQLLRICTAEVVVNTCRIGRSTVVPSNAIRSGTRATAIACHGPWKRSAKSISTSQKLSGIAVSAGRRLPRSRPSDRHRADRVWIASCHAVSGHACISASRRQGRIAPLLAVLQKLTVSTSTAGNGAGPMEGRREPNITSVGNARAPSPKRTPAFRAASPNTDDGRNLPIR